MIQAIEDIKLTGKIKIGFNDYQDVNKVYQSILTFRYNPDLYLKEVLGVQYLSPEIQQAIRHIPYNKRTYMVAGHGVSKSFTCAGLIPWFLETYPNSMVYTTAPTGRQVQDILWKEVSRHIGNSIFPIAGKQLKNTLKLSDDWQAMGFASNEAVAYQGRHAKYLLWILDEADGIEAEIWEAIKSTVTGTENKIVAIGNPVDPDSAFHEEQEKYPEDTFTIPSYASPNIITLPNGTYQSDEIIPGCATLEWIEELIKEYGIDSNLVKSRVLAKYPSGTPDALLTREQVLECDLVEPKPQEWFILGVDVAYEGNDDSVLTAFSGNAFYKKHVKFNGLNGKKLSKKVMDFIHEIEENESIIDSNGQEKGLKCKVIIWDAGGVGTSFSEQIYDRIREEKRMDIHLQPIIFGSKVTEHRVESQEHDMHLVYNKRAEMYMDFRRLVINKAIYIPKEYQLYKLVTKIKYFVNKKGLTQIQDKGEFKKKNNGQSPDLPDSMILAVHGYILRLHLLGVGETRLAQ